MNIYSRHGDGIITPDLHVASTEGKEPVVRIAVIPPKGASINGVVYLAPTSAIAMAEAILAHFNRS